MNSPLLNNIKLENYSKLLELYTEAIALKASLKKKHADGTTLLELDRWIQEELVNIVRSRERQHINQEELVKIMKWKLLRGKWRPRLVQLAESNASKLVEETSTEAIEYAKKNEIEDAVNTLTKLRGVGPATASAILAACVPEKCGFFADEVAQVFLKEKLKYTLNEYLELNQELSSIAKMLNKQQDSKRQWNPHQVELAIWAYCIKMEQDPGSVKQLL